QRAIIINNRFGRGVGASHDITVTANAVSTYIGTNQWPGAFPFASMVNDSGTGTVVATIDATNDFLLKNNNSLKWTDETGTAQRVLVTDGTGTVTLFGVHGRNALQGVSGATYLYDGSGPTGNIVAALSDANSTVPVAGTVLSTPTLAVGGTASSPSAAVGTIRLPNGGLLNFRNATNTSDLQAIQSTSNSLKFGANGEIVTNGGVDLSDGSGTVRWRYTFASNEQKTGRAGTFAWTNSTASGTVDTALSRGGAASTAALGSGIAGDATGTLLLRRLKTSGGTALVAGDFTLSAGWGTGATVTGVVGTDQGWTITVTAAGTPAANPTVSLTFHDGTWTNSPITMTKMTGGTGVFTN